MKTTRLTVVLAFITLLIIHAAIASPLVAQPIGVQAPPGETQPLAQLPPLSNDSKDEDSALERAIAGSLIGPAMLALAFNMPQGHSDLAPLIGVTGVVAMVFGPSAGDWYTGRSSFAPTFARSVGVALMVASAAWAYGAGWCDDSSCQNWRASMITTLAAGGALVVGSTIYDIATARSAARDYNRTHRGSLQWTPMISRTTNGNTAGLALSGSF